MKITNNNILKVYTIGVLILMSVFFGVIWLVRFSDDSMLSYSERDMRKVPDAEWDNKGLPKSNFKSIDEIVQEVCKNSLIELPILWKPTQDVDYESLGIPQPELKPEVKNIWFNRIDFFYEYTGDERLPNKTVISVSGIEYIVDMPIADFVYRTKDVFFK